MYFFLSIHGDTNYSISTVCSEFSQLLSFINDLCVHLYNGMLTRGKVVHCPKQQPPTSAHIAIFYSHGRHTKVNHTSTTKLRSAARRPISLNATCVQVCIYSSYPRSRQLMTNYPSTSQTTIYSDFCFPLFVHELLQRGP